ncbi:MAG: Sua5/YciO/YrdC/YwlC family protein [Oscillospiraceae bacterium]
MFPRRTGWSGTAEIFRRRLIALAERFWPGPLTMILPRREIVPLRTTGGLETVGVRCPDHPVTLAIIREAAGVPWPRPAATHPDVPAPPLPSI